MKKQILFKSYLVLAILIFPVVVKGVTVITENNANSVSLKTHACNYTGEIPSISESLFELNVNPTYLCVVENDSLINSKEYLFDIFIYRTGTEELYLNNYQLSFEIKNVSAIINGGTLSVAYIDGSTQLPLAYKPGSIGIITLGAKKLIKVTGPPPSGCGTLIPTSGLRIGTFKIINTVDFGQSQMNLGTYNTVPATTLVYAIVPPATCGSNPTITNMASHLITLTDPVLNLPVTLFDMTGGGNYCITGPGADVGLSGSETGVLYHLLKNGVPVGTDIPGTGSALSFGPQAAGTYTCTAYRDATYINDTMNGSVSTAVGTITPVITGNDTVCPGASGEIYSTASGMSNYSWNITGGTITGGSSTNTITVDWGSSQPANVSVNYDDNGCTAPSPTVFPVAFKTTSVAPSGINASSNPVCSGGTVTLTVNGGVLGEGASWKWYSTSCGGTYTDSGSSISAQPTSSTNYYVRAEGTCNITTCASLLITANPNLPVSIAISANPTGAICTGTSVTFTANPTNGGSSPIYQWKINGSNAGTNSSLFTTSTLVNGDIVECVLTSDATCPTGNPATSNPITITVNPYPNINIAQSQILCKGSNTTLSASGASTYSWYPATGLSATTGATVVANPVSTIAYTVVGTSSGCSDTTTIDVMVKDLPVITTGPENPTPTICSGNSIDIYANGAVSYAWSPSTGLSSTNGTLVIASPPTTTVYTVTGTNAIGCSNTANITVSVNQSPNISVTTSQSLNICSGGSVTLTASGGTDYIWSPSTALSATTGNVVTASPTSTITYQVTGQNSSGCTGSASFTVTVNPSIIVTVSSSQTICSGDSLQLSANGASAYTWSPATGLSSTTGATIKASPASNTTYTVTGSSGACIGSANVTVSIASSISVTLTPNQAICFGNSLPMTASGATSYTWSPAPGLSATTGANVIATPTITTLYTVTGTSGGCSNTAGITITVNPKPNVTASDDQVICLGNITSLSVLGATTYSWSPATGLSATTGSSVNASPTLTTTYTVIGTNVSGCKDTAYTTVSVSKPNVIVLSEPGGHDSIVLCAGDSIKLFALGTNNFSWSPGTSLNQISGSPVIAFPATSTTYSVTGTDANGCTSTSVIKVTVINCNKQYSSSEPSDNIRIYPNPSNDIFNIELNDYKGKEVNIIIQNITGQEVMNNKWNIETEKFLGNINLRIFSKGIYFLKVISNDDVIPAKIVLE